MSRHQGRNDYWSVKLEGRRFNGGATLLPDDNLPDESGNSPAKKGNWRGESVGGRMKKR